LEREKRHKRRKMLKNIIKELKHHLPFTIFGAITGIILMILFYKIPFKIAYDIFYVLHPIHVVLSALVTASMYKIYAKKVNPVILILIGYIGSIGIATLSDSIIPYIGELLLNLPNKGIHLGFIEKWWLVNPLAFLGIAIAYFNPKTRFPHAGHVLLSTWASLFHIILALGGIIKLTSTIIIFIFLFIAVLIPCCLSDIVFPLLFIKNRKKSFMK
jgi:Fe2+ transport system protein B